MVLEPNYHAAKWFSENLLATKMKKSSNNKPVYLGFLILDSSKIAMHEFWYTIKQNMEKKDNSFIVYMKTEDVYNDSAKDVEGRLDNCNHEDHLP